MGRMVLAAVAAALVALTAVVVPLQAHHSHAMFDGSREVVLEGSITGVRFANPHVYLQVRVARKNGVALDVPEVWAIEMSTVQNQTRRGLTPNVLTSGAAIVVTVNPLFSGGLSGNYTTVVSINGVKNASSGDDWKPVGVAAVP